MTKNTKTPVSILKSLPRKAECEFVDTFDDGFPPCGEQDGPAAQRSPEEVLASANVATILAVTMLHAMVPGRDIARIQAPPSLALIVAVPGPDFIDPVAHALTSFRAWTEVLKRSGASKSADKPSVGNDTVSKTLGNGRSVVGVSTSPERYLPAALLAAADLRIDLGPPTARVLRATIRLVTGRRPGPLPHDIARGLGFDEIASCIRKGSRSRDCVRRLKAASASKRASAPDMADVPFLADTYGYGAAKEHGLALVAAVEEYRRGQRSWASVEGRNILLAGPPGTGKTTYARSLAKSLGVALTSTSVASWFAQTAGYLNDVCRKIDEVFMEAAQVGGILLIDEIDSLPNRETCDSRHREFWSAVSAHVLTTLDGAVSSPASRLIVIGATNFADRLDPALTRPGRLDRIVHIGLPDAGAVEGILRQHLAGDLKDHDLAPVAAIGAGCTGAEIAGWAAGARMAARAAGRRMAMADLIGQIAPPETRSPAELLAIARHEAGHAWAIEALHLGSVSSVSLVAKGQFAARTSSRLRGTDSMSAGELDDLVISVLAGRAADEHWGRVTSGAAGGPGSDLAHATSLVAGKHASWGLGSSLVYRGGQAEALSLLTLDPTFRRLVEDDLARLYAIARDLIDRDAHRVDRLARHLAERRVLGGAEVRSIIGISHPVDGTDASSMGGFHE